MSARLAEELAAQLGTLKMQHQGACAAVLTRHLLRRGACSRAAPFPTPPPALRAHLVFPQKKLHCFARG